MRLWRGEMLSGRSCNQHLPETAYINPLVPGEILTKCRETFLQPDGDVYALDFQGWTGVEQ